MVEQPDQYSLQETNCTLLELELIWEVGRFGEAVNNGGEEGRNALLVFLVANFKNSVKKLWFNDLLTAVDISLIKNL